MMYHPLKTIYSIYHGFFNFILEYVASLFLRLWYGDIGARTKQIITNVQTIVSIDWLLGSWCIVTILASIECII